MYATLPRELQPMNIFNLMFTPIYVAVLRKVTYPFKLPSGILTSDNETLKNPFQRNATYYNLVYLANALLENIPTSENRHTVLYMVHVQS